MAGAPTSCKHCSSFVDYSKKVLLHQGCPETEESTFVEITYVDCYSYSFIAR